MALGGLPPDGPNEGSPCWPIPVEINHPASAHSSLQRKQIMIVVNKDDDPVAWERVLILTIPSITIFSQIIYINLPVFQEGEPCSTHTHQQGAAVLCWTPGSADSP